MAGRRVDDGGDGRGRCRRVGRRSSGDRPGALRHRPGAAPSWRTTSLPTRRCRLVRTCRRTGPRVRWRRRSRSSGRREPAGLGGRRGTRTRRSTRSCSPMWAIEWPWCAAWRRHRAPDDVGVSLFALDIDPYNEVGLDFDRVARRFGAGQPAWVELPQIGGDFVGVCRPSEPSRQACLVLWHRDGLVIGAEFTLPATISGADFDNITIDLVTSVVGTLIQGLPTTTTTTSTTSTSSTSDDLDDLDDVDDDDADDGADDDRAGDDRAGDDRPATTEPETTESTTTSTTTTTTTTTTLPPTTDARRRPSRRPRHTSTTTTTTTTLPPTTTTTTRRRQRPPRRCRRRRRHSTTTTTLPPTTTCDATTTYTNDDLVDDDDFDDDFDDDDVAADDHDDPTRPVVGVHRR